MTKKRTPQTLHLTLTSLPVFDDPYLQAQAHNLEIVDRLLTDTESEVLHEYFSDESTPASAFVLSALSQLWIFGLYEILRTWRQRILSVLNFGEEIRALSDEGRSKRLSKKKKDLSRVGEGLGKTAALHFRPYEKAASDERFLEKVQEAKFRTEALFQRLEALRVHLAKHEKASPRGAIAEAPGSGRLDMTTGSIQWFVSLEGNEVDMVSRREIADQVRALSAKHRLAILAKPLRKIVGRFPRVSYGTWCIKVKLDDGTEFDGVIVSWAQEITHVRGYPKIPFQVSRVVGVVDDSKSLRRPDSRNTPNEPIRAS